MSLLGHAAEHALMPEQFRPPRLQQALPTIAEQYLSLALAFSFEQSDISPESYRSA
jgi:hypothetical protein